MNISFVGKFRSHIGLEEALVYVEVRFLEATSLAVWTFGRVEDLEARPRRSVVPHAALLVTHRVDDLHPFLLHVVRFYQLVFQALVFQINFLIEYLEI